MSATLVRPRCHVTLLVLCVVPSCSGCYVKNPAYPQSWPQATLSEDIEKDIEGSYYCAGDIVSSGTALWTKKRIGDFLVGGKNPPYCNYITIRTIGSKELEISLVNPGAADVKLRYVRDRNYQVKGSWIVLRGVSTGAAEDIVAAHAAVAAHLTVNSAHDLIIKAMNSTMGVIILVPTYTAGTDWGRFTRKE